MDPRSREAFTLIELLVVIAIIAILAVVVVLTLNPAQLLAQSRDANRVADMATLASAIGLYQTDVSGNMGKSSVIYTSLPDNSSSTCGSLGLPALPPTYQYHCATQANLRAASSTGWLPVNFTNISSGAPFGSLPIDPTNNSSSHLYYTYAANGSSQYETTAAMESAKYGPGGSGDVISGDGGTLASVYEKGTATGLEPIDYGDPGLLGYWAMDEGSGSVLNDSSGNGNTGAWAGGSSSYIAGKIGPYAASPNASGTFVWAPLGIYFGQNKPLSATAWYYATPTSNGPIFGVTNNTTTPGWNMPFLSASGTTVFAYVWQLTIEQANVSANAWHFLAITYDPSGSGTETFYVDGQNVGTASGQYGASGQTDYFTTYIPGSKPGGVNSYLNGSIDDVRAYSRTLSAAEILAMYNGGK